MKKIITLLLTCTFLLQSCFTTRYVNNEQVIRNDFRGATVDDVEFEFGEPQKVEQLRNGYAYTYYYRGKVSGRREAEMYTRFAFDDRDYVRNVQSTEVVPRKRFDVGGTVLTCVFFFVVLPVAIVAATSKE